MTNMSRWLDVEVGNDDIDLNTLPTNLALVDLNNDNEFKLLIGDLGKGEEGPKLKVFKGAMQISDITLPDLPLGVEGFYASEATPRPYPIVAVAFSTCIFLYKNMKLFYKYYLPSADLSTSEVEIWKQLIDPQNHNMEVVSLLAENLNSLPHKVLSTQSHEFLALSSEQQLEYIEQLTDVPRRKLSEITCITTLKMHSIERYSMSCLVVGTEDGEVIILDSQTFTQLSCTKLCPIKRTPYLMVPTGLYNVDYRLTVATREKCVCLLKRNWSEGRVLFATDEHIISMEVISADNSTMVICSDNTLSCYSKKGKKQWSVCLEHRPAATTLARVRPLSLTLAAVALASGHVHLYDGQARRDTIFVRDVASVMKFGQLGQEEHVLIIITSGGSLMLKILKRTAEFGGQVAAVEASVTAQVSKPWHIPKKSKLFLEQSMRERENAVAMHQSFQRELNRVRLLAATALRDAHLRADNCVGAGAMEAVRLSAEVEGLGPVFMVRVEARNCGARPAMGLMLVFQAHAAYRPARACIKFKRGDKKMDLPSFLPVLLEKALPISEQELPLIPPNGRLVFPTKVEELFEDAGPDVVLRAVTGAGGPRALLKLLLLRAGRSAPVLAATVAMPPTDPMMLPFEKIQSVDDAGEGNEGF